MELLFSYGTLQLEKVQLSTFGRLLKGKKADVLGYRLAQVEITSKEVLEQSKQRFHPIALPASPDSKVAGTVFEITKQELANADVYEVADYKRVAVKLSSGQSAWMYVQNK